MAIQDPVWYLDEMRKLGRVKQKINQINGITNWAFSDTSVQSVKERLLKIQKLVSEALSDCDEK